MSELLTGLVLGIVAVSTAALLLGGHALVGVISRGGGRRRRH